MGLPGVISEHHALGSFLSSSVSNIAEHHLEANTEWMLMGTSVAASVIMIIVAYSINKSAQFVANSGLAKVLENKWYIDELYEAVILKPLGALSGALDKFVERMGIDGMVNGVGKSVKWGSEKVRLLQTGQVGFYIFVMVLGMIALLAVGFYCI